MANENTFLTNNTEHAISGTLPFNSGVIALPIVATLPSGINNQIVFVQVSGILAVYNNGWKVTQGFIFDP
jgi:hypothetical protein